MRRRMTRSALALTIGAGLLLAGAAFAQPPVLGTSGQPTAVQQNDRKPGIIIDDGAVTTGRPDAIEPGDTIRPAQGNPRLGAPPQGAPQGSGAAGTPLIEPGDIFRPGQ